MQQQSATIEDYAQNSYNHGALMLIVYSDLPMRNKNLLQNLLADFMV